MIRVREMEAAEIPCVVDYFMNADEEYLRGMGATRSKLPDRDKWLATLARELDKPYTEKAVYYLIGECDGKPIGHTNLNPIEYGMNANMHLHLWHEADRRGGKGSEMVAQAIPLFFEHFALTFLQCEPYAENPAPNAALPKLGFVWQESYETIPGASSFWQRVNKYVLTREDMLKRYLPKG